MNTFSPYFNTFVAITIWSSLSFILGCYKTDDPNTQDDSDSLAHLMDTDSNTTTVSSTDIEAEYVPLSCAEIEQDPREHCYDEDVVITTTEDIENIQMHRCIYGDLLIENTNLSEVQLQNLECVIGDIEISENPTLNTLDFSRLKEITGSLTLQFNDTLTGPLGFQSLTSIGEMLTIKENDVLINVSGFDNLTEVHSSLRVRSNPILQDFVGFNSLALIEGEFLISGNDGLQNLTGLEQLSEIHGTLTIFSNHSLTSLQGLDELSLIGEGLSITMNASLLEISSLNTAQGSVTELTVKNNSVLQSLSGLENLSEINGILEVSGNPELSSIEGLSSITSFSPDSPFVIMNNFDLLYCDICSALDNIEQIYAEKDNISLANNMIDECGYWVTTDGVANLELSCM